MKRSIFCSLWFTFQCFHAAFCDYILSLHYSLLIYKPGVLGQKPVVVKVAMDPSIVHLGEFLYTWRHLDACAFVKFRQTSLTIVEEVFNI